jgi:hypothetical protein
MDDLYEFTNSFLNKISSSDPTILYKTKHKSANIFKEILFLGYRYFLGNHKYFLSLITLHMSVLEIYIKY